MGTVDSGAGNPLLETKLIPGEDSLHQLRFYSSDESESTGLEKADERSDVMSDVKGDSGVVSEEDLGSAGQSESYSKGFEEFETEKAVSERVSEAVSERVSERVSKRVNVELGGVEREISERLGERPSGEVSDGDNEAVSETVDEMVGESGAGNAQEEESRLRKVSANSRAMYEESGKLKTEPELYWKDLMNAEEKGHENGAFEEEEVEEEAIEEEDVGTEGPVEEKVDADQVDVERIEPRQPGLLERPDGAESVEKDGSIAEESEHYSDSFGRSMGAQMPSSGASPGGSISYAPGVSLPGESTPRENDGARMLSEAAEKLRTEEEALFARKAELQERTRVEIERVGRSPDRRAVVRQQKLLRLQLDADLADVDRSLASMRAEFVRQRLSWEQSSGSPKDGRLGALGLRQSESNEEAEVAGEERSGDSESGRVSEGVTRSVTESVTEEVGSAAKSQSSTQSIESRLTEEIEELTSAEEEGLELKEIVEISATAFSSIAIRRLELELEQTREEASRLQKEKREREIQDEIKVGKCSFNSIRLLFPQVWECSGCLNTRKPGKPRVGCTGRGINSRCAPIFNNVLFLSV
jgi:hypothetical protein